MYNYLYNQSCEFKSRSWRGVPDTTLCDHVFVSNLRQVGDLLRVLRVPPPIESDVKYHKHKPPPSTHTHTHTHFRSTFIKKNIV